MMQIERAAAPKRVSRIAAALALALTALVCAASASADFTHSLTIGSSFNNGAGVALGTNAGLYTGPRSLTVTSTPTGVPGVLDLDIAGINPMPTIQPPLDPSVFHFTLLSNPQLDFDTSAESINGDLTGAPVQILVERKTSGITVNSDIYLVSFTTGTLQLPACGGAPARSVSGSYVDDNPNDGLVDEATLVAAVCMRQFGTISGFNTPLELRIVGSLAAVCPDKDDGVSCTVDGCHLATFDIINEPFDSLCDDNNVCDGLETCDAVLDCQEGTPLVEDDGIACTIDTCDPILGVSNATNDAFCSDGDVCDGLEICDAVLDCQEGTPLVEDDGIACTSDSCDPILGVSNAPNDVFCSDGDVCTGAEFCDLALDCQAGAPPIIDDGIACTSDSCHPVLGVSNSPDDSVCDDADVCTGIESCDVTLGCQAGTPLVVDDGVGCTLDSCDPVLGVSSTPDDSACDDADLCTGIELCDATLDCQAGTPLDADDGISCTLDNCDPVLGVSNTADDSVCSDSDLCNGVEFCDTALDCQAGAAPVVDDGVACTIDSCDPILGVSNSPDHLSCDDGDSCTGMEFCDATLDCQQGTPMDVDDGIACTID
ncbi:MAG: hypothetical protein JRH19_26720, partial [Deltaproteobacteria bacterium]|nr:hypothetical protein [Deltaproteobacteria bacterium]